MMTNLYVSLSLALAAWWKAAGNDLPAMVGPAAVLVTGIAAGGFLYLVARLSWAARQFVATCRERQQTERKMIEMLREYLSQPASDPSEVAQMWAASASMAVC